MSGASHVCECECVYFYSMECEWMKPPIRQCVPGLCKRESNPDKTKKRCAKCSRSDGGGIGSGHTHILPELFRFCNNTQKNSIRIIIFAKHAHIHVCAHYIMPMFGHVCVRSRLYEQFFGHFKWNNKTKRGAFNRRRTANNINGPDEKKRERKGAHVSVCAVGCVWV